MDTIAIEVTLLNKNYNLKKVKKKFLSFKELDYPNNPN